MKTKSLLFLFIISIFFGCTNELENDELTKENTESLSKKESSESEVLKDENFKILVRSFKVEIDNALSNTDRDTSHESVLPILGFESETEFFNYHYELRDNYNYLLRNYNITPTDLNSHLVTETSDSYRVSSCVYALVGCLVSALSNHMAYLSENAGVGCVWRAGSACFEGINDSYNLAINTMYGCLFGYLGC